MTSSPGDVWYTLFCSTLGRVWLFDCAHRIFLPLIRCSQVPNVASLALRPQVFFLLFESLNTADCITVCGVDVVMSAHSNTASSSTGSTAVDGAVPPALSAVLAGIVAGMYCLKFTTVFFSLGEGERFVCEAGFSPLLLFCATAVTGSNIAGYYLELIPSRGVGEDMTLCVRRLMALWCIGGLVVTCVCRLLICSAFNRAAVLSAVYYVCAWSSVAICDPLQPTVQVCVCTMPVLV